MRCCPGLNLGAKSVVLHDFDAERALQVVDEEGVTQMSLPSRTWRAVLDERETGAFDSSSLERLSYGTSAIPRPLLEELVDEFGENVSTAYGMTEMGPVATAIRPEDVLYAHPGVENVAVVGEEDEQWRSKIVAFVVRVDADDDGIGADDLTAEELDAYCTGRDKLAEFKRPRSYYFVDELPGNPSGKIQRFKLRERADGGE